MSITKALSINSKLQEKIEMTEEYLPIIEGRLKHAEAIVAERIKEATNQQSEVLF